MTLKSQCARAGTLWGLVVSLPFVILVLFFVVEPSAAQQDDGPGCPGGMEYLYFTARTKAEFTELVEQSDEVFVVNFFDQRKIRCIQLQTAWEKLALTFGKKIRLVLYQLGEPMADGMAQVLEASKQGIPNWRIYYRQRALNNTKLSATGKKDSTPSSLSTDKSTQTPPGTGQMDLEEKAELLRRGPPPSKFEPEASAEEQKRRKASAPVAVEVEEVVAAGNEGNDDDGSLADDEENLPPGLTREEALQEGYQPSGVVLPGQQAKRGTPRKNKSGAKDAAEPEMQFKGPPVTAEEKLRDQRQREAATETDLTEQQQQQQQQVHRGRRPEPSSTPEPLPHERGRRVRGIRPDPTRTGAPPSVKRVELPDDAANSEGRPYELLFVPGDADAFSHIRQRINEVVQTLQVKRNGYYQKRTE